MTRKDNLWLGIGCGLLAGAFWGLVFLAPELASDFSPLQLAAGRYLAYGAFALALVAPRWRRLAGHVQRREWLALTGLSLLGNTLYYILLAFAVQMGGVAMTSVVIGFLPVAVTTIGSFDHGAVRLRRLAPALALGAAGVACIAWEALQGAVGEVRPQAALGLACAAGALASWTAYAVLNGRWLARLEHITAADWSLLTGVATGAQALVLAAAALAIGLGGHTAAAWGRFLAVSAGVAIFASIIGNALWNRASRLLPMTLVGQMIVFETLFALLYGFLWEARAPTALETAAIALMIASVLSCVSAHRTRDLAHAQDQQA